ncbi:MAG: hypothetical protein HRT38_04550 [Alteromonadaceae bacterium]|nr:hypothetical protein [Alteromonadaceae bacterium]
MKILKTTVLSLLVLGSMQLGAKENQFEYKGPKAYDFDRSAPQVYIFNKNGELIHSSGRFFPGLKKAFKTRMPLPNSETVKINLMNLLSTTPKFEQYDFSVFYFVMSSDIGKCAPCDKQENVIKQLKKKIKNMNISYNKVTLTRSNS